MANVAWGIDIGNRALKAVKLQRVGQGVQIADFAFIEHDTILSEAGDNRESLVQTSLAKFVGRHESRRLPIAVGVGGQQSFARFVKLPPVEAKKVPEIVKFEAIQQIPFPLDEVEWSWQLFQKPDDPDLEVGIFAMRKELVNDHVHHFLEVDLDVHAVQTSPLAVYNAMRFDGRLSKGHAVIVDLGADSTDLVIADADSIWMRSLDIGGNNFTEALGKAFKIDFEKAEEMKRNAKTSKYAKQIYQAMRPVFGELVSEIQRSLGFFGSTHREVKLRKVIALGGGFKLNGLSGYLQKNLQMPVEKPTKFSALPPDEAGAASALSENILSTASAYGLALQVLDEGKVTSSLLPTHIRKDKLWRDKTKYFVGAAGMVVGAVLIAFAGWLFQNVAFDTNLAARSAVDGVIEEAQRLDQEWTQITQDGSPELRQVQNVNSLVQDRAYWGRLIADITNHLPGPEEELARALRGEFGQPGVIDQADLDVILSVPRDQRNLVQLERIESVYSDGLFEVVNASNFLSVAEEILERRRPDQIRGVVPRTQPQLIDDPVVTNERARGFILRLTLTTPLPYEQAIERFHAGPNAIALALVNQVRPNPNDPDKPYEVAVADARNFRPFHQSSERVAKLQREYEARMQLAQGLAGPQAGPGGVRGAQPRNGGELGFGRAQPRDRTADTGPDSPIFADPLTGESRYRDTEFHVILAVVLDPEPFDADAPQPADPELAAAGRE